MGIYLEFHVSYDVSQISSKKGKKSIAVWNQGLRNKLWPCSTGTRMI